MLNNPSLFDIIKVLLLFPILGTAISLAYNGKTRLQIENTKGTKTISLFIMNTKRL